jgi:AcrR family transcriptional regulator
MGVYSRFGSKDGLLEALFLLGFDGLHAAITEASGADALARLRRGCAAYRSFALAHPHLYELMFRQMLELELSAESLERAEQTFSELVGRVGDAMAAGLLAKGDEVDVAQQIWNAMHGAVTLELAGVTFSAHPERTFASMIDSLLAGLAAS